MHEDLLSIVSAFRTLRSFQLSQNITDYLPVLIGRPLRANGCDVLMSFNLGKEKLDFTL